jgi:hypothetical protein
MRTPIVLAALTAASLGGGLHFHTEKTASADAAVAPGAADVFRLAMTGSDGVCRVERRQASAGGDAMLGLEPTCAGLYPDLSEAVAWHDGEDGTVSLLDAAGKALVVFAVSDGFAYESIMPAAPMLQLAAVD